MPASITFRRNSGFTALMLFPALTFGHQSADEKGPLFQLELANDMILSSDNQFTNGVGLHLHSARAASLEDTRGTPAFGRFVASPFLPDSAALTYRESWVLGQTIQTPDNIETSDLILNDVPYAGALTWSNNYYAFNNTEFYGVQWLFGWVGPDSHADATQKAVHSLIGGDNPRGWSNQLESEPLLNVQYSVRRKFFDSSWLDASVSGDLALGNWITYAQTGFEFRFGDRPQGFAYIPDPPGRGVDSDATIRSDSAHYLYGSIIVRGAGTAYNMLYDGNLIRDDNNWTEQNTIEPETWTGHAIFGVHYTTPSWGAHLTLWLSTKTIEEEGLANSEDPRNSFGSLMVEYQF